MRKILIISNDQEAHGAKPSPHTFNTAHETMLQDAAGSDMQIVVALPDDAVAHYADAEVVASFPMRMPELSKISNAKWIHLFSAGVDKVLTPLVAASEILLSSSSGIHATPIAEHILATCLVFTRGFEKTFRDQVKHVWLPNNALRELRDAHVLIVGLGEIGKETARLLSAFGAHVSAVSRSGKGKPDFVERLETADKLVAMLPDADFVIITLPGTKETEKMFDAQKFTLMKPNAILINIGRGTIVNENDLIEALKSGTIAGAALDVFEKEPLPGESPLWDMENVVITPHHSGLSHKYMDRAIETLCKNIHAYIKSEALPNEVDKTLGY